MGEAAGGSAGGSGAALGPWASSLLAGVARPGPFVGVYAGLGQLELSGLTQAQSAALAAAD